MMATISHASSRGFHFLRLVPVADFAVEEGALGKRGTERIRHCQRDQRIEVRPVTKVTVSSFLPAS
jgi:hypothetical protein